MQKNLRRLLIAIIFLFLVTGPVYAQADEWKINSFHSDIHIEPSGVVAIKETLSVTFNEDRRGIIRSIPYLYKNGDGEHYTELTVRSVTRNNKGEKFEVNQENGNKEIRIGESSKKITGTHTYVISYAVEGVLRSFSNFDEFYWNVTGNYWDTTIAKASASVKLPEDGFTQLRCYQGAIGSTEDCRHSQENTSATFSATKPLSPGEGLTIAAGYTTDMVPILRPERPLTTEEILLNQAKTPLGLTGVAAMVLAGIWLPWWLWYKKGRDYWWQQPGILESGQQSWLKPWSRKPQIVVEYTPPLNLRPAQVGKLLDQKADTLDITATIVDLASRGYVTITEIDKKWIFGNKDYQINRTKKSDKDLLAYEKLLVDKLFGSKREVKVSTLKNSFYEDLEKVKEALRQDVLEKGYFVDSPKKVRETYLVVGILSLIVGMGIIFLGGWLIQLLIMLVGGVAVIAGLGIAILSGSMPQRTAEGFEAYRRVLGYQLFISTAEKHRQQFFENKNIFTEILPYAMIFGLTDKLAKALEDMGIEPPQPSWYHGTTAFNAALFSQNLTAMSTTMSQQMASMPGGSGSGGGGSSGGGFGGGGGGSW